MRVCLFAFLFLVFFLFVFFFRAVPRMGPCVPFTPAVKINIKEKKIKRYTALQNLDRISDEYLPTNE